MNLITSNEMILKAQQGRYAIPAFNIENMEMAMAVAEAANEMQSPIIMQTTPSTIKFAGIELLASMVKAVAARYKLPIALHVDHGENYDMLVEAVKYGYTSLMIDGSKFDFEKNIEVTKEVVKMANAVNIPVEAELGKVGGKEDDKVVNKKDANLTDPDEAVEFVKRTKVISLAVAIGTAHGFYKSTPSIDFKRLSDIAKVVSIPLVLHGGTGVPEEMVKECISLGICKVNFATELRKAATSSTREILTDEGIVDPKIYMKASKLAVMDMVKKKILMCGSQNKIY